ncbi:hypothetical protein OKC48_06865 [Methylorubrum extorquens]|uniref:hypothetical protein n=1 Tax=Methylorubrum extorquens TaxID=408 RepID=UPI0022373136|nr:hypothetical protein [Methylorubrum extorquens]UYW28235.1 hypothetical protein OKC48_06865 [Methylorubrum extorquens]
MSGRLIPWHDYVRIRPAMVGCPCPGILALRVEWEGADVVRICGLLAGPGREVPLLDLTREDPRPIMTEAEIDATVRAAVMALVQGEAP